MIFETNVGIISLGLMNGQLLCQFGKHAVDKEPPKRLAKQLDAYLSGKTIQHFSAPIPHATYFTQKCWEVCRDIPYGKTLSYKELTTLA